MEKTLFANYPKDERLQMLENNADAVEVISYLKHFESVSFLSNNHMNRRPKKLPVHA